MRAFSVDWTERVEFSLWLWPLAVAAGLTTLIVMQVSDHWMRPHETWEIVPVFILPSVLVGVFGYLRVLREVTPVASAYVAYWQRPMLLYAEGALLGWLIWRMWFVTAPGFALPFVIVPFLTSVGGMIAIPLHAMLRRVSSARRDDATRA